MKKFLSINKSCLISSTASGNSSDFQIKYLPVCFSSCYLVLLCLFVCFCNKHVCSVSRSYPTIFDPLETAAQEAPLWMGYSWQEYWSRLPFPPPGDLPSPRIEPISHVSVL